MVVKRGNSYCVVHSSPKKADSKTDKPKGTKIKCYSIAKYGEAGARRRANKQHAAIVLSKQRRG